MSHIHLAHLASTAPPKWHLPPCPCTKSSLSGDAGWPGLRPSCQRHPSPGRVLPQYAGALPRASPQGAAAAA
eukprot:scaffold41415_cov17-Tisochrysis_lutea.AAC.1